MEQASEQTKAMKAQVEAIQTTADKELAAVREQVEASKGQNEAVKEAARAQLQPVVFAHEYAFTPNGGQASPQYYLANEGTGPALDIQHGVEMDGARYLHGFPDIEQRWRALSAGESEPRGMPLAHGQRPLRMFIISPVPFVGHEEVVYWTQFSNVFGERFEVRNPKDPTKAATFKRVDD